MVGHMKKQQTVAELRALYDDTMRLELSNRLARIEGIITEAVDKAAFEIIANALGMTRERWHGDRWQVDHCNGRRTAVAEELGKVAMAHVMKAFPQFIEGVSKKFPRSMKAAMEKEYLEQYTYAMRRCVKDAAEENARKDAERVISEFNGKPVWACSHCDAQSSSRFLPAGWETDEDDRGSIRHLCAVCAEREKRQPVQGEP